MLGTLRQRLILSHVLPLLVVIPVMGIALIYVLETRVLLADLANELTGDAMLIAELIQDQPNVWGSPAQAEVFVNRISRHLTARVMLLDSKGRLLASSDPADVERLGQVLDLPPLPKALAGEVNGRTAYSTYLHVEITDAWVPVFGSARQIMGVVRLSHRPASMRELLFRLRYLVLGVLAAGLLLGSAVGLLLALNIGRPLRQVTQTISRLASGRQLTPLTEQGPEEICQLLHAVNTLVARLHDLEETRRQLLANLVHELGRPLGALYAAIQVLRSGADEDPSQRQELLEGTAEEIGRLRRLLDDLAQLHDQVLGTLELNRQPLALSAWLSHLLAPWGEAARRKSLYWGVTVPPDLPTVEVDRDRLAQALGNLISNAIKYTPAEGTVSIEAGSENGAIWMRVSDTGPGIAPEEQAHIFTPFYRGRQAGRFPRGMGLGLNIARELVVAHGGRIEVESTPGQGSCFTIWVPLASPE
jgi:two-component system sensor histidine kinase BaeS